MHPYDIVREFEKYVADYAGASFGVAIDSCSNALFLCCKHLRVQEVSLPSHTHPCVPAAVIHAGGKVFFKHYDWSGCYRLEPYPIVDSACRFRRGMHTKGDFTCVSFNYAKHLKIGKGGMILTDDSIAATWFRKARYCGMHETPCMIPGCRCDSYTIEFVGWNMYMTPEEAGRGLMLMQSMSDDNPDLLRTFPDLSSMRIYVAGGSST